MVFCFGHVLLQTRNIHSAVHSLLDILDNSSWSVRRRTRVGIVHPGLDEERVPTCAVGSCYVYIEKRRGQGWIYQIEDQGTITKT